MKQILFVLGVLVLSHPHIALAAESKIETVTTQKPNFIIILADDLSYGVREIIRLR